MSQLQKLLDEKWPMTETDGDTHWKKVALRDAFTEGYNAAMQEAEGVLMGIVKLEKIADDSVGFVDNSHTKALRKAASNSREFILTIQNK